MKKTFKKNILKNNKYNFKTELLLSALALLVGFGTTACKKDNVKPKNNNTETPVNPVKPVDTVNPVNPPVVPPKDSVDTELENAKKVYELNEKNIRSLENTIRFITDKKLETLNSESATGKEFKKFFFEEALAGRKCPNISDSILGTNAQPEVPKNGKIGYVVASNGILEGDRKYPWMSEDQKDAILNILKLSNTYTDSIKIYNRSREILDSIKGTRSK